MIGRRIAPLPGLLAGLLGLGLDFFIIIPSMTAGSEARSLPDAFITFWTYFTHLTNLGLVLVYLAALTGWRWLGWFRRPHTMALLACYITLVMVYYHFALAPFFEFEGGLLIATILLHYVAPLYFLFWWAAFAPHGALRLADLPRMVVPGLVYVAWALARGAVTGDYPYAILDAGLNGYGGVAIGVGMLLLAVLVLCAAAVLVDRRLGRRAASA